MLPISPAYQLEAQPREQRWLVEELWADQAVGIIGGEPKCCKSFMALSLGVAVASGKPCLGRFAVPTAGRVLLYPAEDALPTVRRRLQGICAAQGIDFQNLPLWVITAPRFQLDVQADRTELKETIEKLKPSLLILDPFVRLHMVDENASGEVAKLLQHLRYLQRTYRLAVALVHHAKKGAGLKRPGQALRGSSEFHAWGDSNLYLTRFDDVDVRLTIEHRSEKAHAPLALHLCTRDDTAHLEIVQSAPSHQTSVLTPEQRVIRALTASSTPLRVSALRERAALRNQTVVATIAALVGRGVIQNTDNGYRLVTTTPE